jgi:hypothetical protein
VLLIVAVACSDAFSNAGRAATLTSSDGFTTLSTLTTVTPGPYTSGQKIKIVVQANSVISAADLPGSVPNTGHYYVEECADPNEATPSTVITGPDNCEALTVNDSQSRNQNSTGGFTVASYPVYDLPDPNFPSGTLTGTCDVAPNTCVLGIFVEDPSSGSAFTAPHLFSAPFNVIVGDGSDAGDNPGDGSAPAVASTSATNSTVNAASPSAVADGLDSAIITVNLYDSNDNPVTSGKQVSLTQSAGASSVISTGGTQTSTTTTNGSGQAIFSVTDLVAEPVTYTATDVTDNDLQIAAQATVQFVAPAPSASSSTMSANPTTVAAANGTDASVVTVTLNDQAGEPLAHKLITVAPASGQSVVSPAATGSDTTNAEGQATFSVTDTADETVVYTATDTTDHVALTGLSATVTFGVLSVSGATSTVTAAAPLVSTQLTSGGQLPTGQVTVTLFEADGTSRVAGKTVTLTASLPSAAIVSPSSEMTGQDGSATFSVSDATDQAVTFSAEDTTDSVPIAATALVTFETPQASTATSELLATSAPVPADGVTAAPITVTMKDQFGGPIAGATVTVAATVTATGQPSTTARVAPATASGDVQVTTTDGGGSITFDAYDTTAETVTFTATDTTDNVVVAQTGETTFTAGAPQVDQSSLQANPTSVPADGSTASTVTVTLEDHNDNPIPGLTVALNALDGSSSIVAVSAVTNAAGVATFKVTDNTAEIVTYRATDTTDDLPLVGQEIEITFGTPKPVTPVGADSAIVSNSSTVPADGHSTATISVILNDDNGLPIAGKVVALSAGSGSSTVTAVNGTTDATGTATFNVSDSVAEAVTYTATDTTDGVPLTGLSATVAFVVAPTSSSQTSSHLNAPVVGMAATPDGKGYWLVAADGGVFTEGDAVFYGSAGGIHLNSPVVGMAATPDGKGYWLVAADGGVFTEGDAVFYGSAGGIHLNSPVVAMAATPDGGGYWLVAADGGVFTEGDAVFYGSEGGIHLNSPVVGMAATPDGKGYWLVAADGGVFTEGDAVFYGSMGSTHLNSPIVGMAATPDGKGYWLVAADGGVFTEGDAVFYGSAGGIHLNSPVVGMAATPDGGGYWLTASDGGIFNYKDAVFYGSMAG